MAFASLAPPPLAPRSLQLFSLGNYLPVLFAFLSLLLRNNRDGEFTPREDFHGNLCIHENELSQFNVYSTA